MDKTYTWLRMVIYALCFGAAGAGFAEFNQETSSLTIDVEAVIQIVGGLLTGFAIFMQWGKK